MEIEKLLGIIGYNSDYLTQNLHVKKAVLDPVFSSLDIIFDSDRPIIISEYENLTQRLDELRLKNIDHISYSFHFNQYSENDVYDYFNYVSRKINKDNRVVFFSKTYELGNLIVHIPHNESAFLVQRNQILKLMRDAGFEQLSLDLQLEYDKEEVAQSINSEIDYSVLEAQARLDKIKEEVWVQFLPKPIFGSEKTAIEIPDNQVEYDKFQQREKRSAFVLKGIVEYIDQEALKKRGNFKMVLRDDTGRIYCSRSLKGAEKLFFKEIEVNQKIIVQGYLRISNIGDVSLNITNCSHTESRIPLTMRVDVEPKKRVELNLHTKMSALDGVDEMKDYCEVAAQFGHTAIAVTDTGGVQSFHDLYEFANDAKKNPNKAIKPLYGVELNYVDEDEIKIAHNLQDINLEDATYVVFDLETTGISVNFERIIEVSAVKIKHGVIIDQFTTLVNPEKNIHYSVSKLTTIKNEDVAQAPTREVVLKQFRDFIEDCVLVAHNASFDIGHLNKNFDDLGYERINYPLIDTLILAKALYPGRRAYGLAPMCKFLNVRLDQHHRALADSTATGQIFVLMLEEVKKHGVKYHSELNTLVDPKESFKYPISHTIDLLVQNQIGLRNLYHIVSIASTENFSLDPIVTKKVIEKYREGILVGSGDRVSHFFDVAFSKTEEELEKIIGFYDYIEIEPTSNFIYEQLHMDNYEYCVQQTYKKVIAMAKKHNIPVVAVGDVHQINKDETLYRSILVNTERVGKLRRHPLYMFGTENDDMPPMEKAIPASYYKTTKEMLEDFSYLGSELAYEVVVTNTNLIADSCEFVQSFNKNPYPPKDDFLKELGIPSAEGFVKELTFENAHKMYGELLPGMVKDRIDHELEPIIGNKFSTIYAISHLIVKKSREDGYEVGSRGSVGSSLVAYLMEITEVNSLPPHYYCPKCSYSAFKMTEEEKKKYGIRKDEEIFQKDLDEVTSGYDLPDAKCPVCGTLLIRDGQDIPFETFLGVKENPKTPDIDLNFSSENQGQIHNYIREIFGYTKAFRAGTISASQDKISYAIVRDYFDNVNKKLIKREERPVHHRKAEIEGISNMINGSKRTCGQHPGGVVVVPIDHEIYDVTPVQYPGDSSSREWMTTHFDYHTFEKNLFKLDVLGHDDPTCLKYLMEFVKKEPELFPFKEVKDIPVNDHKLFQLMNNTECIGCSPEDLDSKVASFGIPEFGTAFVRELLEEAKPTTFGELLKVSGLSHGTDVWKGNAEDLLLGTYGVKVPFKQIIGCRDDIMVDLISYGVPPLDAFNTMEFVRKGNAPEQPEKWGNIVANLSQYNIPRWYFDDCAKIAYLFPKAHATAYVINALRMGWFKMYQPIFFYSAILSKKLEAYDIETMLKGAPGIREELGRLKNIPPAARKNKDDELIKTLELCLEMCVRGYTFLNVDLYKSDARNFVVSEDHKSLYIPFMAIDSLGRACADSILAARAERPFDTQADFMERTQTSKKIKARFVELGVFKGLQEDDQLSFNFDDLE